MTILIDVINTDGTGNTCLSLRPLKSGLIQNHSHNNALKKTISISKTSSVTREFFVRARDYQHVRGEGIGYEGSFAGVLFGFPCLVRGFLSVWWEVV